MSTKKKAGSKAKTAVVGKKDPGSKNAKMGKTSTRYLPCVLTDDDLLARGAELASAMTRVDNLKDDLAASTARSKEAIKAAEKEVEQIHRVVFTKREERAVECVEVLDYERRTVRLKRTDTDEVVEARAMTEKELQVPLAFPRAVEKKGAEKGAETKAAAGGEATPAPAATTGAAEKKGPE